MAIICVDFDGILCENKFPDIGPPNEEVIGLVKELINRGDEVVLWTTRNGKELELASEWCKKQGLNFITTNAPAPSNEVEYRDRYPTQSRKIYADIYIDDHNLEYICNKRRDKTRVVVELLKEVLNG